VQPLEKNRSQKNKQGKSRKISKHGKIKKMKRIATMIVTDMKSTTIYQNYEEQQYVLQPGFCLWAIFVFLACRRPKNSQNGQKA